MNIIEEFNKNDGHFKKDAVIYARENKEKSKEELLEVLKEFTNNLSKWEKEKYNISVLYALYLLSEFRDERAFPQILKILEFKLPKGKDLYDYFGECIADRFSNFVVSTFNGDANSLYKIVDNKDLDPYSRSYALESLAYLCKKEKIKREKFLKYLEEKIKECDFSADERFTTGILTSAETINAIELIKPLRNLYTENLVDINMYGQFDEYLNHLFKYDNYEETCIIEDTIKSMSWWAMFDKDKKESKKYKPISNNIKNIYKNIGRNDPCPCGSGKKYKKCCLNKVQEGLPYQNHIDEAINKFPKKDLYKLYKKEYVDMDYLMYKALVNKPIPHTINRDKAKEIIIDINYLNEAYTIFKQIIENDKIKTIEEYNDKVAIHYTFNDFIFSYLNKLNDYFKYNENSTNKQKEIIKYIEKNFKIDKYLEYDLIHIKTLIYVHENKIEDGIKYLEKKLKSIKDEDEKYDIYDNLFYLSSYLNEKIDIINKYIEKAPKSMKEELKDISTNYLY